MRNARLRKLAQWVGILSAGETDCAIRCHRDGITYCCEAVAHFGGTKELFTRAFAMRHNLRKIGVI